MASEPRKRVFFGMRMELLNVIYNLKEFSFSFLLKFSSTHHRVLNLDYLFQKFKFYFDLINSSN